MYIEVSLQLQTINIQNKEICNKHIFAIIKPVGSAVWTTNTKTWFPDKIFLETKIHTGKILQLLVKFNELLCAYMGFPWVLQFPPTF